jgi:glyoxylase-like metal-dependent hydrolase (beta-lactamase superfamily II)
MDNNGRYLKIHILLLLFMFSNNIIGQIHGPYVEEQPRETKTTRSENSYFDKQAKIFLDTIQSILAHYPPSVLESTERGFARLLMDAVFNEEFAVSRKPAQEFFHARVQKMIDELENTKPETGAKIWRLYNMGYIVRTPSVTLAFDFSSGITSGSQEFAMGEQETERIVNQCDALFISHLHKDHAEKKIAEQFINKGLPVFAPAEVWKDDSIQNNIINPERTAHKTSQFEINGNTLEIVTYPGHQMNEIECNVYLVKTEEGIVMSHLGDQINRNGFMKDFEWIDNVKENYTVDILMPNVWTADFSRILKGFNPKLIVPSFEPEDKDWDKLSFGGELDYFELKMAEMKASNYPFVDMMWGESYDYLPEYRTRRFLEYSNFE